MKIGEPIEHEIVMGSRTRMKSDINTVCFNIKCFIHGKEVNQLLLEISHNLKYNIFHNFNQIKSNKILLSGIKKMIKNENR